MVAEPRAESMVIGKAEESAVADRVGASSSPVLLPQAPVINAVAPSNATHTLLQRLRDGFIELLLFVSAPGERPDCEIRLACRRSVAMSQDRSSRGSAGLHSPQRAGSERCRRIW